jgi:TonB-linked SusC/RagA family outer membrane protein
MKQSIQSIILLAALLLPGLVFGQRAISGKVTDGDTGDPLVGAKVVVVGQAIGTLTSDDGSYTIQLPDGSTALKFSYFGYTEQEVTVGASNTLNVSMAIGTTLGEVLLIGYGTVKREDATGSVQSVTSESFNQGAINSPQELVAGKVAGVQITTGAAPGDGATIRIRGGSSLSATNDPLIVIDGVPVFNDGIAGSRNPLNIINPNDIETFTVLKDASATAIYGSRASNGVILITTKKGRLGKKLNVGYNGNFSVSTRANEIDALSADEFRTMINTQFEEGHPARDILGDANTDWQDQIFQNAIGHDHNLNVSGGIGSVPYRVSVGYTDREGILKTDDFNRVTGGINLNPQLLDNKLQINISLKGMLINNQFADQGAIGNATAMDPTQPVFDEGNPFGGYYTWTQPNGDPIAIATRNPVAQLEQTTNTSSVNRLIANASIDYRMPFLEDLRANLNLGYDASNGEGSVITPENAAFAWSDKGLNRIYEQQQRNELLEFYLNYAKDLETAGGMRVDVMAGYSWQRFFRDDYNYATNAIGDETVPGGKVLTPENRDPKEYFLVSLFGRANLTFFDRLLLTFTLRQDGTSRFSEENRFGLFPAAALAYKVVEDGGGPLSNLKVRLGYGVTGQQDIGGDFYPYLARYQSSFDNAQYQFGDIFYTTLRPNGYDANIKWEETTTYNVALDYGFLEDRITGSVEVYYRETKDLLNFVPVPAGTNLTNFITTNVGDLENRGIEFSINAIPIQTDKLSWDIGFNATLNRNKITRLTATDDPDYLGVFTGGISGGVGNTIQIHSVGFPANSFYVYEQVYDDAGKPIEGLYVDRDGDGTVTPDDRYHFENPAPDAYFGFTSRIEYGNFDLMFAGRANVGNHVYNNIWSDQAFYNRLYISSGYLNNVHQETDNIGFTVPQYFSDHFIQNASFLRFDHITLGYNLANLSDAISNLRLYGVVQNPFVISQYPGLDPEIANGIDGNIYPRSRTFVIGVNANF